MKKKKHKNVNPDGTRQLRYLATLAATYPNVWKKVESFRQRRGTSEVPDWPAECYLPLSASAFVVAGGGEQLTEGKINQMPKIIPLSAWSITKGIYRFDPTVFESVWETPLEGELPVEILSYLPEWCVYIETPGRSVNGKKLYGFFATLDYDPHNGSKGLELLVDGLDSLSPVRLPLVSGGLAASLKLFLENDDKIDEYTKEMAHLVSLVLYVCAVSAEFRDAKGTQRQPGLPEEVKTKGGTGLTGVESPTVWETGYRMGAALRLDSKERGEFLEDDATHASPRPHIRRAHWHSFWTGRLNYPEERKLILKWVPPTPVNVKTSDDLIPTIKSVP